MVYLNELIIVSEVIFLLDNYGIFEQIYVNMGAGDSTIFSRECFNTSSLLSLIIILNVHANHKLTIF